MKVIRRQNKKNPKELNRWKILVVDDEIDILRLTRLNLKNFSFESKSLQFLEAASAEEARTILEGETDVAVALIDVVMETDDAGLKLVEYIRNELDNNLMRIIIRTGQPGIAPEKEIIDNYDIDGYKDKTELTAQKLYTTMRSALKSYRDLNIIEANRRGLELILKVTPDFYLHSTTSMTDFFEGILTQIISLCGLGKNGLIATIDGFVTSLDNRSKIEAVTGNFTVNAPRTREIEKICTRIVLGEGKHGDLPNQSILLPLVVNEEPLGYVYLENTANLSEGDNHLIQVMVNQCAGALENILLQTDLMNANKEALYMLAVASEFKDKDTGDHIRRICKLSYMIAAELGMSEKQAKIYSEASILHDVGKLGIPDEILQKPEKLDDQEFKTIRTHPLIGGKILDQDRWFKLAKQVAIAHHEKWDGTGYPNGLKGEEIPLPARIVAICDVFDALTHRRPYKEAWPIEKAIEEIMLGAGAQFDPQVTNALECLYKAGRLHKLLEKQDSIQS